MDDLLKLEDFTELRPGELRLDYQGRSIPLEVAQTRRLAPHALRAEPFAVTLRGPGGAGEIALPQDTYRMHHPRLGDIDIFIVPVGRGPAHMDYEAIFN